MSFSDASKKIKQALDSLELFGSYYASSEEYQKHKQQVAGILRQQGQNQSHGQLLVAVADAIEKSA